MKLLFEEYEYRYEDVKSLLPGYLWSLCRSGKVKTTYVGYFFSQEIKDSVFILPKVFLDQNGYAFKKEGQLPEDVIDADIKDNIEEADKEIMFSLSVWIYQAIRHFSARNPENIITDEGVIQNVVDVRGDETETLLEAILSLRDFAKKHRHLFTYITKINHSGTNKIHWSKTISTVQPIMKNGTPLYLKFKTKQKAVNYDETLIVLFYSVLSYINKNYKFRITIDVNFDLYSSARIVSMIETGKGTRLLRSIRKNYFTDELVSLWKLLYVFFDKMERIESNNYQEETLLVRSFNVVFEDMVDQLLGDIDLQRSLTHQDDGKIVDHIYSYASLINDNEIYYIGDSKYYKADTKLGRYSIAKQYTYAKNVVQYNIDILNSEPDKMGNMFYRDEVTEGYNITPNFFIKGTVEDDGYDFDLHLRNETDEDGRFANLVNYHFPNRLFDRDTYILQTYNVNFLYVISSYVMGDDEATKDYIRKRFKDDLVKRFDALYDFYILKPIDGTVEETFRKNFHKLIGKVIRPRKDKETLILALETADFVSNEKEKEYLKEENLKLLIDIQDDFEMTNFRLGEDDDLVEYNLAARTNFSYYVDNNPVEDMPTLSFCDDVKADTKPMLDAVKCKDITYLVGCYKNQQHLDWILDSGSSNPTMRYNIRFDSREGSKVRAKDIESPRFLVLYNLDDYTQYNVYSLTNKHSIFSKEDMADINYPSPKGKYFVYYLKEEVKLPISLDLKRLVKGSKKGEPMFVNIDLEKKVSVTFLTE